MHIAVVKNSLICNMENAISVNVSTIAKLGMVHLKQYHLLVLDTLSENTELMQQFIFKIRESSLIPIIVLSNDFTAIKKYINSGADDFIIYEYENHFINLKIESMLRRNYLYFRGDSYLLIGALKIDFNTGQVYKNNKPIKLYSKERDILIYLAKNPNRIVSSHELFEKIWGWDSNSYIGTVMTNISTLRKKIEDDQKSPKYLITVRDHGYMLKAIPK